MSFKDEINALLNDGYEWTDIANTFAESLTEIHDERLQEQAAVNKVSAVKEALQNYYNEDSSFREIINKMTNEEVQKLLDSAEEIYNSLESLTFPLKKLF